MAWKWSKLAKAMKQHMLDRKRRMMNLPLVQTPYEVFEDEFPDICCYFLREVWDWYDGRVPRRMRSAMDDDAVPLESADWPSESTASEDDVLPSQSSLSSD